MLLMRAINARQKAADMPLPDQSNWGLGGVSDGGKEYPPLDALDGVADLTPYVAALQNAPLRFDRFWNAETGAPFASFAELRGYDAWQSPPEQGNLEEIRAVVEKLHTLVIPVWSMFSLAKYPGPEPDPSTVCGVFSTVGDDPLRWDLACLWDCLERSGTTRRLLSLPPPEREEIRTRAARILDYVSPSGEISRAFLSFVTRTLQDGPSVTSAELGVTHVLVVSQDKYYDDMAQSQSLGGFEVQLRSWGKADPGTLWADTDIQILSAEDAAIAWDGFGQSEGSIGAGDVGAQEGVDWFSVRPEAINAGGVTHFQLRLGDESFPPPPPWRHIMQDSYTLKDNTLYHLLLIGLAFPLLPEMPDSF
ncbi:MAG TPA: hypothetical protein DCM67_13565 [Propionibacteriaceae bacterium]|nr:hypothetical protein [Propionibacteriaceae bacterium]